MFVINDIIKELNGIYDHKNRIKISSLSPIIIMLVVITTL